MSVAKIGDTNHAGTARITDTEWNGNGTLHVWIEDLAGTGNIRAMRRLARRAIHHPEKTRSSACSISRRSGGTVRYIFHVSRLELTR